MAVMVKVLPFHDELPIPPLVKVKKEELLIVLLRSLPKTSVLPGLRGLFSGGKSGAGEDCSHGDTKARGKAGCGEAVVPSDERRTEEAARSLSVPQLVAAADSGSQLRF
jgi:hypothetical protein